MVVTVIPSLVRRGRFMAVVLCGLVLGAQLLSAQTPSSTPAAPAVLKFNDEPFDAKKTPRPLVDDSGIALIPQKVLLTSDYLQATDLSADRRYILLRGLVSALSASRNSIRISEPVVLQTVDKPVDLARQNQFNAVIVSAVVANPKTGAITVSVTGYETLNGTVLFRLSTAPIVPDERFRNLGPSYWAELTSQADTFFPPLRDVTTFVVLALPGSVVTAFGKEYPVGASGQIELPAAVGRVFDIEVRKAGTYKLRQKLVVGIGSATSVNTWRAPQVAYSNPYYLEFSMIWGRYPTLHLGLPLEPEHLFATVGFNFYGIGLKMPNQTDSTGGLFDDLHLLELGGGLNWYINSRFADFRLFTGLEIYLRLNLQGSYVIDELNPVVCQVPLGFEISLSKETSLFLGNTVRYTFSLDPTLGSQSNQALASSNNGNSNNSDPVAALSNLANLKIPLGVGILEVFVPTFGLRVQL
jgi:hypothetical protein